MLPNMLTKRRPELVSKRPKEKVVHLYELLLRGEKVEINTNFWEEFFLLQPNCEFLEQRLQKVEYSDLPVMKTSILLLFKSCVDVLDSDNVKRINNSLVTLSILVLSISKKSSGEPGNSFLAICSDDDIRRIIEKINILLVNDNYESTRYYCMKLLFILITGKSNLSKNILEHVMINNLFDPLKKILSDPLLRQEHGYDIVTLITLLISYRKDEGSNPYIVKLSLLDDEVALNGFGQIIATSLFEFTKQQTISLISSQTGSWITSISSMVGQMFLSEEVDERMQHIRQNNALLLGLYEAVHLNRNFITTLATTQAETSSPPSPSNTLNNHVVGEIGSAPMIEVSNYPTNLLVAVFQYCSLVMIQQRNDSGVINLKLCFIILTCITEDQYANSIMHDSNLTFKVYLHKARLRHRKFTIDRISKPQTLAATLLDLLVEFIVSHKKKFPMELYLLCIGIIHRMIVYQKRCRIRLIYPWRELWTSLIGLLKFVVNQEHNLVKKFNIFKLVVQAVDIFNLFITFGDAFLATTSDYDELYYEINREEKVFSEIHAMVLRYTAMDEIVYKEDVLKLLNSLINILAIIKHFQVKIKEWLSSEELSTPTEEQILFLIQKNYDLTLKLQNSLDFFPRYSESPYKSFFQNLIDDVIIDTRKSVENVTKIFDKNRRNIHE